MARSLPPRAATEFSCGWVVFGADINAVKQGLKELRIKAFVGPPQRHHTCIFPSRESLGGERPVQGQKPREAEYTDIVDGATVCSVVVTDHMSSQSMTVTVFKNGQCRANVKLPMYATQAARARQAEEDLADIARGLDTRNPIPKVDVDQPIKLKLLRLMGLELAEFAFMAFDQLFEERLKSNAKEKWDGYSYVNALGQDEPFALSAEEVTAAKTAMAAQEAVDFRKVRTARQWLDLRKMVDPATASPMVMEHLQLVLEKGLNLEGTADQLVVVREGAAMLLGRCMAAQQGKDAKDVIAAMSAKTPSKTLKALWKVAMAGADSQLKPKQPLPPPE
jgi:hypothetical protein